MPAYLVLVATIALAADAPGNGDWPTFQRDNRRRATALEELAFPLHLVWKHESRRPPSPAWPEEAKNDYYNNKFNMPERVTFDRAFHLVGKSGRVVFASSSEDCITCLHAATGETVWMHFASAPIRVAPTLHENLVLFGCDDGFAAALNFDTGDLVWRRRLAPNERLVAGNERIISLWPVRTDLLVDGDRAFACAGVFPSQGVFRVELDPRTGEVKKQEPLDVTAQGYQQLKFGRLMVPTGRNPAGAAVATLVEEKPEAEPKPAAPAAKTHITIRAGATFIHGGDGLITAKRATEANDVWSARVEGGVYSLAIVDGRLLASTDRGTVYCFAGGAESTPTIHAPAAPQPLEYGSNEQRAFVERQAGKIIANTATNRGYVLFVTGDRPQHYALLAAELAQRTELHCVVCVSTESAAIHVRRQLFHAGLAGRVAVHAGTLTNDKLAYSSYLFNAVAALEVPAENAALRAEVLRVVRPHGGVAIFDLEKPEGVVAQPSLPGEGSWTHLYGNPANTACSGDTRVTNELEMQWFGPPGPRDMIDRHHRTVSPLYVAGRLFIPGDNRVTALDAYNGTILWERPLPNSRRVTAFRDSSYLAADPNTLYVAAAGECLALQANSGEVARRFAVPKHGDQAYEWGYLAIVGDRLLGSAVKAGSIRREQNRNMTLTETHYDHVPVVGSDQLFAYNVASGGPAWSYASARGLIVNQTLTVVNDRIYFLESDNPETLKQPLARAKLEVLLGGGSRLVCLNAVDGKLQWQVDCPQAKAYRHNVFAAASGNVLALVGSRNSTANEPPKKLYYEVHAFDAANGGHVWSKTQDQQCGIGGEHGEQERHPAIVSGAIYCEPFAYDLATGNSVEWKWPWTAKQRRGCGTISASASTFYFRSNTAQSFDLKSGGAKPITAESRPGCWINLLPAGGMLLAPEASSGCSCNFAVQCSLGMLPKSVSPPR